MMNYIEEIEQIDHYYMVQVLEASKLQTSQIVIIPRFVSGQPIYGINERTIVSESRYQIFNEQLQMGKALWRSPNLSYIAFYSKDVAPFLRLAALVDTLFIKYHTYIVNGVQVSVAVQIFSDKEATINNGNAMVSSLPIMPLIPYDLNINLIFSLIEKWKHAKLLEETRAGIDLNAIDDFSEMYAGLASQGAIAISPSNQLIPYTIYLSKSMFNFAKKDEAKLYIATDIPGEIPSAFMIMVSITRTKNKKKSFHNYYVLGYKMI